MLNKIIELIKNGPQDGVQHYFQTTLKGKKEGKILKAAISANTLGRIYNSLKGSVNEHTLFDAIDTVFDLNKTAYVWIIRLLKHEQLCNNFIPYFISECINRNYLSEKKLGEIFERLRNTSENRKEISGKLASCIAKSLHNVRNIDDRRLLIKFLIIAKMPKGKVAQLLETRTCADRFINVYELLKDNVSNQCIIDVIDKNFDLNKTLPQWISRITSSKKIPDEFISDFIKFSINKNYINNGLLQSIFQRSLDSERLAKIFLLVIDGLKKSGSFEKSNQLLKSLIEESIRYFHVPMAKMIMNHIATNNLDLGKICQDNNLRDGFNFVLRAKSSEIPKKYFQQFNTDFGRIDYQGGLLYCAQLDSRKNYSINAIILNDVEEFESFMDFLSSNMEILEDSCIIFAVSGAHWISGIIGLKKCENNSYPVVFFIDPVGLPKELKVDKKKKLENVKYTDPIMTCIQLSGQYLDKVKICVNHLGIQKQPLGCSVFTLLFLQMLNNIDQYISSDKNIGIIDYLCDENNQLGQWKDCIYKNHYLRDEVKIPLVIIVRMPIKLTLLCQTIKIKDALTKKESPYSYEYDKLPINKKGQTAKKAINQYFRDEEVKNDDGVLVTKPINKRVSDKYAKMGDKMRPYLHNNTDKQINNQKKRFTFDFFKFSKVKYRKLFQKIDKTIRFIDKEMDETPATTNSNSPAASQAGKVW